MLYPRLIIFDCDGVLVDSEVIDARIRSECFRGEGFSITAQELADHFDARIRSAWLDR